MSWSLIPVSNSAFIDTQRVAAMHDFPALPADASRAAGLVKAWTVPAPHGGFPDFGPVAAKSCDRKF
jgi:hypothetical protein